MIAEASNNGNQEQGGSPMDLASHASQADQPDHGTSSGPAAESRPFPWVITLACLGLVVAGFYLGKSIGTELTP